MDISTRVDVDLDLGWDLSFQRRHAHTASSVT
jgi:hypothetical protein